MSSTGNMNPLQDRDANAVPHPVTSVAPPVIDWSRVTTGQFNENIPAQTKKPAQSTATSKKRKSDTQDDIKAVMFPEGVVYPADDDRRVQPTSADTCGRVRQKIRKWIESGAMKVGEFQLELGVSSPAYNRFMQRTGTWDGEYTDTYYAAVVFFKKREVAGLPLAAPKAKRTKTTAEKKQAVPKTKGKTTEAEALVETTPNTLDGEETCTVPVYMHCNEVRKGLRALLQKGLTNAALCRALSKQYPESSGQSVSPANLRYFMGQTGLRGGNSSAAFYAGYCLLEKLRIKQGKPKSDFRHEMEKAHGSGGFSTEPDKGCFVFADETVVTDKYGAIRIMKANGKML